MMHILRYILFGIKDEEASKNMCTNAVPSHTSAFGPCFTVARGEIVSSIYSTYTFTTNELWRDLTQVYFVPSS
jgi:hypothetical protein